MLRSSFWFGVVLSLAGLWLLRESRQSTGVLVEWEERGLDWLTANVPARTALPAGRRPPPGGGVALVEVGDTWRRAPDTHWPPNAFENALFLQSVREVHPAVVAIEPVWRPEPGAAGAGAGGGAAGTDPDPGGDPDQRILARQALLVPKLLLAVRGVDPGTAAGLRLPGPPPGAPAAANATAIGAAGAAAAATTAQAPVPVGTVVAALPHVSGDRGPLPELSQLVRYPPEALTSAATCAPVNFDPRQLVGDPDEEAAAGVGPGAGAGPGADGEPAQRPVRSLPLLFRTGRGEVFPSFVLAATMLWLRLTPAEVRVRLGVSVQLGDQLEVPIDETGAFRLNYRPPRGFFRIGVEDLTVAVTPPAPPRAAGGGAEPGSGSVAGPAASSAASVEGTATGAMALTPLFEAGVTVLGRTDRAARVLRRPDGTSIAAAEVFALALTDLQTGTFVRRLRWWEEGFLVAALAAAAAGLLRLSRCAGTAVAVGLLGVYALCALGALEAGGWWLPLLSPVATLGLGILGLLFLPKTGSATAGPGAPEAVRGPGGRPGRPDEAAVTRAGPSDHRSA